jgi:dihydropyrimidinase
MRTLIKNGTVVTAVDQYKGDVLIEDEKITVIGTALEMAADKVIDATAKYVLPGGIDVHTHMDMPFGGTTSADDFETGTIAAAFGGTTSIVDFAIQYRGQTLHHAMETWAKKAEGSAVIDYGFHMIITELNDQVEGEMDALGPPGASPRSSCSWPTPASSCSTMRASFKALLRTGRTAARSACTRERRRHRRPGAARAAEGKTAPKYHALTRPARAEAEATAPRDRARRDRRRPDLHRPLCPPPRRWRWSPRRATAVCRPSPKPVRSTCSVRTTTTRSPTSAARNM